MGALYYAPTHYYAMGVRRGHVDATEKDLSRSDVTQTACDAVAWPIVDSETVGLTYHSACKYVAGYTLGASLAAGRKPLPTEYR